MALDRAGFFPPARTAVAIAFLVNGFAIGSWAPQVPILAGRLGFSEGALGLLILVFGLGAVAAMPAIGAAISRGGSRRPLIATHLLLAPALTLLVVAPSPLLAVPAIFFFGMMLGGMDVAMNANAVAVERGMGRAIMSSCHGFWSMGGMIGAGIGGPVIAALGAPAHAVLAGLLTLAALLVVVKLGHDDRLDHEAAQETGGGGGLAAIIAAARRDRSALVTALAIGVFALIAMLPEGAAIDWSAIYLRGTLGADVVTSGLAFAAFSAAMATFRFLGDGIRDRLGAVNTVRLFSLVAASGLLLTGLGGSLPIVICGFALTGIGLSNIVPIAFSAAGNVPGLKPGIGISIATAIGYSGGLLAPSAIGLLAESVGLADVYVGMSALVLVVLALSGMMAGADARKA
ncbi:MFS transporter [Aurantimonas sp. VKM B-3413]|uniref:MFS transporter n=1 Tax=Aurantimonas sp. VKM B-3413 TaxID=2779401 RepID=UPI001E5D83C5|nr:MFS transporter [Aurantimonas sp. VKM B-3413]MCB8840713.1 MFS transporter [Aurantimonas sp. VKM B-3413]